MVGATEARRILRGDGRERRADDPVTVVRAGLLVLLLVVGAYANSLGNGFAYDDNAVIPLNPVVTSGDWEGALENLEWLERPAVIHQFPVVHLKGDNAFLLPRILQGQHPFIHHDHQTPLAIPYGNPHFNRLGTLIIV